MTTTVAVAMGMTVDDIWNSRMQGQTVLPGIGAEPSVEDTYSDLDS